LGVLGPRLRSVTDQVRCYLATEEQLLISSILERFPEEFALHLEGRCSVAPRRILVPKIIDISDGAVVYDDRQERKQPDWTYLPDPSAAS
jgi:NADH-quinone oxidoreductase subunit F